MASGKYNEEAPSLRWLAPIWSRTIKCCSHSFSWTQPCEWSECKGVARLSVCSYNVMSVWLPGYVFVLTSLLRELLSYFILKNILTPLTIFRFWMYQHGETEMTPAYVLRRWTRSVEENLVEEIPGQPTMLIWEIFRASHLSMLYSMVFEVKPNMEKEGKYGNVSTHTLTVTIW
jgi:hypothetical protein